MDQGIVTAFSKRLISEVNAARSCLNLYLGYRLDLYRVISDAGPVTPSELAQLTGCNERYLREWLECMVVGGYLDHESDSGYFSLTPEKAVVLLDHDSMDYIAPSLCLIPSFANALPTLIEAFRSGSGVPCDVYGAAMIEGIGLGNRAMFVNDYVAKWVPTMPDIEMRLQAGARVAEIGCGVGWSSISLAQGFPNIQIDALDIDAASIKQAQYNAQLAGVADRIVFHLASAEEAPLNGSYDLVTAFELVHMLAYPVKALCRMHELATPDGAVMTADGAVGESLEENSNLLGSLLYNTSVLHCLPQAMGYPGTAGTGAIMRPSTLRNYAKEAGFTRVDVLPIENRYWRFFRLTP